MHTVFQNHVQPNIEESITIIIYVFNQILASNNTHNKIDSNIGFTIWENYKI